MAQNKYIIISILFSALIIGFTYFDSIGNMVRYWYGHEEFGHAFFLPVITIYLIWLKRFEFDYVAIKQSWIGLLITFMGVIVFIVGDLSAIFIIQQYSLVTVLIGVFMAVFGLEIAKKVTIPLLLLYFMIPLPGFLYNTLSGELQLISSQIGVFVIRLFDISVYLEGNVIDLGVYKLQVVEACSGLRYLFPLMTLGLITAYIFKASKLSKVFLFLSTIPITVLMNSFRIGMIGVLVEYYGISMAEGFLHDFEGWFVFMACMGVLIFEMWLINYFSKNSVPLSNVFDLDEGTANADYGSFIKTKLPNTIHYVLPVLVIALAASVLSESRDYDVPDRSDFSQFPSQISGYTGKQDKFDADIIQALNFDDYLISNYKNNSNNDTYNIYVGYYESQKADKVPHSPKACLPGGGWLITDSKVISFEAASSGVMVSANRVVINKEESKQLVYYWFKQRDRIITSEYLVKWFLLIDAITKNRTDGALVRFVTLMGKNETLDSAEKRMQEFIGVVNPTLVDYVPD